MKITSLTYIILLIAVLCWCSMILLAPLAAHYGYVQVADLLYTMFGRGCHQLDSHSFHLYGEKLGVCARCSAIYFGFLLGIVLYPLFRSLSDAALPHRHWLLVAVIPICVDAICTISGIHAATSVTRLFTGSIFGFIVAFIIVPGLQLAVTSFISSSRRHHACKT
jgi:uncharacterized membrane protein